MVAKALAKYGKLPAIYLLATSFFSFPCNSNALKHTVEMLSCRQLLPLLLFVAWAGVVSPAASPAVSPASPPATFSNKVIFTPPANYTSPRVLYPRTVELRDGSLLATWENYSPEPPAVYFPIYRSTDNGSSWTSIARVTDQTPSGWGLRYQPFLYELPADVGAFKAGTVLCAGNAIPTDLSRTQIDVYASTDGGLTWAFVSHVAAGGTAHPNNGQTPVWEPFLLYVGSRQTRVEDGRKTNPPGTTTPRSSSTTRTSATPNTARS